MPDTSLGLLCPDIVYTHKMGPMTLNVSLDKSSQSSLEGCYQWRDTSTAGG